MPSARSFAGSRNDIQRVLKGETSLVTVASSTSAGRAPSSSPSISSSSRRVRLVLCLVDGLAEDSRVAEQAVDRARDLLRVHVPHAAIEERDAERRAAEHMSDVASDGLFVVARAVHDRDSQPG